MTVQGRSDTRLRYRFANLEQARAHVHDVRGQAMFFVRDDQLRFLPDTPVCLSLSFDEGEVTRLLHGRVAGRVEGAGTWLELADTRPLGDIPPTEAVRRSVRIGCDEPVEARLGHRVGTGRMLDLSPGGARLAGIAGFAPGDHIELRLLSAGGLTFHDLSYAHVVWVDGAEMGVQFDRSDAVGRNAVARLLVETEERWAAAWEGAHPPTCCGERGLLDPVPPREQERAAGAK
ncbi:MAG TPA: PilZ domain-containing protein [Myxococcales bacterium]|nr:PilZ domain-containing protein [Myxococcales bacterium]